MRPPRVWLALALLCVTTLIAYAPSFLVPFQFDDYGRLANNEPLQNGQLWAALTWLGNTRLLSSWTLWLDYQLYGDQPVGYHLLNLTLHLSAACGVFALAVALCATPRLRGRWTPRGALVLATVAALVFALHPLQTEAVTYIIQRAAVMAAAFYVWAVVCYVRGRNRAAAGAPAAARRLYLTSAGLGVAALLSKENAATLPFVLLAAEWIFVARPRRRAVLAGAVVLLALALALVAMKAAMWNPLLADGTPRFTFAQRMVLSVSGYGTGSTLTATPPAATYALTQALVLPRYLVLLVLPWGLNVDPDVAWQTAPSAAVLGGAALVVGLMLAAVAAARRAPVIGFGLWWLLLALSIESSVIPLADAMAERRLYLAMPGVGLIAGTLAAGLWRRAPRPAALASGALITALAVLTFARLLVWQSPLTLWRDAADKSPGKARPWLNLGVAHSLEGRNDRAIDAYCRALALQPDDDLTRENLELALMETGRMDPTDGKPVAQQDGGVIYELPDAAAYCPQK
ncbi:MAG: tetratricopeptide repeat protein [Deltaproteobacteria bacterium]|nr:tetratricopeptide repeat protein [Deltaproteobacteria bacterium]